MSCQPDGHGTEIGGIEFYLLLAPVQHPREALMPTTSPLAVYHTLNKRWECPHNFPGHDSALKAGMPCHCRAMIRSSSIDPLNTSVKILITSFKRNPVMFYEQRHFGCNLRWPQSLTRNSFSVLSLHNEGFSNFWQCYELDRVKWVIIHMYIHIFIIKLVVILSVNYGS